MSGLTSRGSATERIEQAIARGLTVTRICDTLGVSADKVHAVWDRLDEAVVEIDVAADVAHREQPDVAPSGKALAAHGTHAAFIRHRKRDEQPCAHCRVGERSYNTERKRQRRAKKAAA